MATILLALYNAPWILLLAQGMRRRSSAHRYAAAIYCAFVSVLLSQQFGMSLAPILLGFAMAIDLISVFGNRTRRLPVNVGVLALVGVMLSWVVIIQITRHSPGIFTLPLSILAAVVAAALHGPLRRSDEVVLARALVWGGVAVAVACVIQVYASRDLFGLLTLRRDYALAETTRVTGTFANPNAAGLHLAFAACGLICQLVDFGDATRRQRLRQLAVLGLLAFAVYNTESRAALLAFVIVVSMAVARRVGMSWRSFVMWGGVAVIVTTVSSALIDVVSSTLFPDRDSLAVLGREGRWQLAIDRIAQHPWFGSDVEDRFNNAHNDFLQVAQSSGLPALFLFVAVLIALVVGQMRWGRQQRLRRPTLGLLILCAGVTVGLSHTVLQSGVAFWVLLAFGSTPGFPPATPAEPAEALEPAEVA